jgi:hypothetical protein
MSFFRASLRQTDKMPLIEWPPQGCETEVRRSYGLSSSRRYYANAWEYYGSHFLH